MPPAIKIDQAGKSAGVAGQAREDLATGVAVTLTASGGPFLAYRWRIVSKPVDILANTRSGALLATPTASVTTLSPINLAGTHLIELAVNSGNGIGAGETDIVRITFYAGPVLAPTASDLPRRVPAPFETTEHTVPDVLDPSGNPNGWSREMERWFAMIRACAVGKSWARGRITNPGGAPALLDRDGVADVVNVSPGLLRVTFSVPMPDVTYSVITSAIITNTSPSSYAFAQAQNLTVNSFDLLTYDVSAPGPSDDFDVGFRVEYVGG